MTADEELQAAERIYHLAAQRFGRAIQRWVADKMKDAYPDAVKLVAHGEYGEEGEIRLRARQVLDAGGVSLGDYDDPTVEFDEFADLVDPYLDWLADINGDDYLGEHEIDATADTAPDDWDALPPEAQASWLKGMDQ